MRSTRSWATAGLVAGLAGLATSYAAAMLLTVRDAPVVAVAEVIIRLTPGPVTDRAIDLLGPADKPVLVIGILVVMATVFAGLGVAARGARWVPGTAATTGYVLLAAIGAVAVLVRPGDDGVDLLPVGIGLLTWVVALIGLSGPLRRPEESLPPGASRRRFLVASGVTAAMSLAVGLAGRILGSGRRHVEEVRSLLRLSSVTDPGVPPGARVGLEGLPGWQTPSQSFYQIDTALVVPAIEPSQWSLRIHGMVETEIRLSYDDLASAELTEAWITLNCVSNPVGGPLIGNAWWSGVRVADLLARAGVDPEADGVLQTSADGWTCLTPLEVLTDDRDAMLAVGMNGRPLPLEHGFPVRMLVPGLYGYVSATKWLVDLEVTRFDRAQGYWTDKGWAALGPVKMSSRIDVPRNGDDVTAGSVGVGGYAWSQTIGIARVEVAVDGGEWLEAEVAQPGTDDTWVQWARTLDLAPGDHELRVRATDKEGLVQTGARADVRPDGSTGWHSVVVTAS